MGIDTTFGKAFAKSQLSAGVTIPLKGNVLVSVKNSDKEIVRGYIQDLSQIGFKIYATKGTANFLQVMGLNCKTIKKVKEGSPNIVDYMDEGKINLIFNTTEGSQAIRDSFRLRRSAINNKIPYYTTTAGAKAVVKAIKTIIKKELDVCSLQKFFKKEKLGNFIKLG